MKSMQSKHIALSVVLSVAMYLVGYLAGDRGYLDHLIRPLFAAFNIHLRYMKASMGPTSYVNQTVPYPQAPMFDPATATPNIPPQLPSVPISTLPAADSLSSDFSSAGNGDYAPYEY